MKAKTIGYVILGIAIARFLFWDITVPEKEAPVYNPPVIAEKPKMWADTPSQKIDWVPENSDSLSTIYNFNEVEPHHEYRTNDPDYWYDYYND